MSKKISKQTKTGKKSDKASAESRPAAPAHPEKPAAPVEPEKPLVASNTEEGGNSRSLFGLLAVAILIGGGFATQTLWTPYVIDYLPGLTQPEEPEQPEDTFADRLEEIEQEVRRVRNSGEAIADLERQRSQLNQSFEGVMARIIELEKQIDYVRGMLQATSPPSDAVQTNESLQRLSSRMKRLEASDETVNAVMERLARLEQAMADSDTSTDSTAEQLSKTMAEISQRIGSLESGATQSTVGLAEARVLAAHQVQAQTLVLAVGHLRETLRDSAPFTAALEALASLAQGDPDIMRGVNQLTPYAQTGIATMDTLAREYNFTARAIAEAAPQADLKTRSEDVLDDVLSSIKSLVSVRKAGTPDQQEAGEGPAKMARARLDAGDLAGAVAVLSALEGPQATAAAPWLKRARARLVAETELSRLHVFVVSLLTPVNN